MQITATFLIQISEDIEDSDEASDQWLIQQIARLESLGYSVNVEDVNDDPDFEDNDFEDEDYE